MAYGGVQSYGLNGKDYPILNKELNRLKTSMGYPSTTAFGEELTSKEYKLLRDKTGKEIAKRLMITISQPEYKSMDDRVKVKRIEDMIDAVKDKVKTETFKDKYMESQARAEYRELMTDQEAKQAAKEFMNKRKLGVQ